MKILASLSEKQHKKQLGCLSESGSAGSLLKYEKFSAGKESNDGVFQA